MELCHRTVLSLDEMASRAPWVKRLANTCRVLFQGKLRRDYHLSSYTSRGGKKTTLSYSRPFSKINRSPIYLLGAQSCIAQGLRDPQPSTDSFQQSAQNSSLNQENMTQSHDFPVSTADHQWNQSSMIEDWGNLPPPENAEDMFQLFDNFLAGNPPSMMSILEHDMGMFDPR
jgi:hypothetical protein